MNRPFASAALALACALLLPAAAIAQAAADGAGWMALDASWCTAPHDDYRRGYPVVEIRQFRDLQVAEDAQTKKPVAVTARIRSAMVSAQTRRVEFVGAWVEYRFDILDPLRLKEPSTGLALSLAPDRQSLIYRYGESKPYPHERCGAADVALVDKAPLAAAITLPAMPPAPSPPASAPKNPAVAQKPATTDAPAAPNPARTRELNRSQCLAMESTASGFFGFVNNCDERVNYTYCTLDASTANGALTRCRSEKGEQLGEADGFLRPGETAYISLPTNDTGRVVWFACKYPGVPSLTRAEPPGGRCR